jgi:putative tricarboxylic transport membrane protein
MKREKIVSWPAMAIAVLGLMLMSHPALAQKPYYQGKTLNMMVDFSAGGPTDIECRIYARYLNKHLPGQPKIIITNRPGAGGTLAMNWLYERARRNGTVAGCQTAGSKYLDWFVGDPKESGLRANMAEITPVMFTPVVSVGVIKKQLGPGINKPEDLVKAPGFIAGGFRADNSKDIKFRTLFDLVGAKYKYVTGYPGSADLFAAFVRKEIDYVDGSTPFYFTRVKPVIVDKKQAIPIWYGNPKVIPGLEPAYTAAEFVKKITGKEPSGALWSLFQMNASYRMILLPPGAPKEAIKALRAGFEALGRDPEFLTEYEKIVGIKPDFVTDEKELKEALAPWKEVTPEMKKFRLDYIDKGRELAGQS